MDKLSDNALMLLVKAGDLEKISLLFERYYKALYGFLYHLTGRREASEDMVQTVFYRMLKYRHSFTEGSNFSGWMYQMARNVLKDQQFGVGREYELLGPDTEKVAGGMAADERLEKAQAREQLYDALAMLRPDDREILMLNRIKELKYPEISKIMGITEGAARVRVFRAVEELRQIFIKKGIKRDSQ